MRKLDAASHRTMPWKNGGGSTTEIARSPAGGSLDDFDWRISLARIEGDGPFSRFAGVDRSIVLASGRRLVLAIAGRGDVTLEPGSPPFFFPGDVAVHATLPDGPVVDLNVMTRRGRARQLVTRVTLGNDTTLEPHGDTLVLIALAGAALAGPDASLGAGDAVVLDRRERVTLSPRGDRGLEAVAVDLWSA